MVHPLGGILLFFFAHMVKTGGDKERDVGRPEFTACQFMDLLTYLLLFPPVLASLGSRRQAQSTHALGLRGGKKSARIQKTE